MFACIPRVPLDMRATGHVHRVKVQSNRAGRRDARWMDVGNILQLRQRLPIAQQRLEQDK